MRLLTIALTLLLIACEPRAQSAGDWDRKDAYQFCNAAISDYPATPAPPCQAMHMCANEGALSDAERKKLYEMLAKAENCASP